MSFSSKIIFSASIFISITVHFQNMIVAYGFDLKIPVRLSGRVVENLFNIMDFGAVSDNSTLNTLPISKAIDAAANSGGGIVLIPSGTYLTGGINMSSGVYIYLQSGAFLLASNNYDDYAYDWDFWDLIHGENVDNCGIIGEGIESILSGPMWQMIRRYDSENDQFEPVIWTGVRNCRGECRPRGIVFVDSTNITISNFWLRDSADWSSLYRRCSNVFIDSIKISGSNIWPNNDGIDLESGSNITITNTDISVGDDGIVFVSGNTNNMNHPWPEELPYMPLKDVYIANCSIESHSGALKFEAIFQEHHGDVHDITIENVAIKRSNRGLGFQLRTGEGSMFNIVMQNISVETMFIQSTDWWGAGEGVYITSVPESKNVTNLGSIFNVSFVDVSVVAENVALLSCRDQGNVSIYSSRACIGEISFTNFSYVVAKLGEFVHAQHDFRPLDSDALSEPSYPWNVDGMFLEHVGPILLETTAFSFRMPAQPYWNTGSDCVTGTEDSLVKKVGSYVCGAN